MLRHVITRPAWLILIPAFFSFLAWIVPWPAVVRRGFDRAEPVHTTSLLYIFAWYALLVLVATLGWATGRRTEPVPRLDAAQDDFVYRAITIVSAVGVIGMYALVELTHPGLIARAVATSQFNLVRNAVPRAPGLSTLRYASILGAAIAVHRMIVMRQRRAVHVLNVVLLIGTVLLASRLALIMTVVVLIGLIAVRPGVANTRQRVSRIGVTVTLVLALSLLTFANYVRNAGYYEQNFNTRNPLTMVLGESVAYLGAPFQVSLGTGAAAQSGRYGQPDAGVPRYAAALARPTFTSDPTTDGIGAAKGWYRNTVSVDRSLTTNSSLAAEYGLLGVWEFLFMGVVCAIGGFVMGHLSRYRSYLVLGTFVVGYCFAEIWRTYLFSEGIVAFLLIALVVFCALSPQAVDALDGMRGRRISADRAPRVVPGRRTGRSAARRPRGSVPVVRQT